MAFSQVPQNGNAVARNSAARMSTQANIQAIPLTDSSR